MAIEFENPITAGTSLVREAINSPNFVTGVSGWSINQDGSAEFTNMILRGLGAGDIVIIGPATGPQVIIGNDGANGYIKFPTHGAKENFIAQLVATVGNAGAANEFEGLIIAGPSTDDATDRVLFSLSSQNDDGSSDANFQWSINQAGVTTIMMSLDKNTGLDVRRDLSVRPLGTAAGDRYFDVNAPAGFNIAATLLELFANSGTRFQVKTTGQTTITKTGNVGGVPLTVIAEAGQTGDLLDMQVGANPAFNVDNAGELQTYASNTFHTYVPAVGNGGTATFSTQTGWYMRVGSMVFVNIFLAVNAAGSGAGIVTVDLPTSAYRGTRQALTLHTESVGPNGSHIGNGAAICFTGGSGATIDRLRTSSNDGTNRDVTMGGADLLAGGLITIQGWYREA